MKSELKKRLFTALIISIISYFIIFNGGLLFSIYLILIFSLSIFEWYKLSKNKLIFIIGTLFLIISCAITIHLRNDNFLFLIILITIAISSDLGGFIFGNLFKGPKLTKISPNKTYAGLFGSYFLSVFIVYLLILLNPNFFDLSQVFKLSKYHFITIIIFSSINQLGDLIISYFKRLKKVKDTGNLLPGHGGILDRIDGMIFLIPLAYFLNL